jgi:hypothetical protein
VRDGLAKANATPILADVSTERQCQDAARVSPKFDLKARANFLARGRRSQRSAMGPKIIGFILYLAVSYGVIYALISKRFQRGWNIGEQRVRAAVLVAMVVIIAVGTILVGPLPVVLLVVSLVAFIDYIGSSETLAATASDRTPDWRLLPPPRPIAASTACVTCRPASWARSRR